MARVLLVLPRLTQSMGVPYLGQQYLASALIADGHEVRACDPSAPYWQGGDAAVVERVESWAPDLVGMTLFTYNALAAYGLAKRLRGATRLLVAGGAHPTACPDEPLAHGFDVSVAGEGERVIRALARSLDEGISLPTLPGVRSQSQQGPAREVLDDLDSLEFPLWSYSAWEPAWYGHEEHLAPGGMMTSRGCPARCTFCANYVTGRAFRWRSPGNVIAEQRALLARYGVTHFSFWDDAFTARRDRLLALCDAMLAEPDLGGTTWSCITPANMVSPADLGRMREAGCVAINFGLESGSARVLGSIRKGQRPERLVASVRAARNEGMSTVVNFMFGFPDETLDELKCTLDLMHALSEHTDFFNHRGVLVPFPGTDIYEQWHEERGFSEWWLEPERLAEEPELRAMDPRQSQAWLEYDPTLDQNFFHYSDPVREMIAACVRFKAQHNEATTRRYASCVA